MPGSEAEISAPMVKYYIPTGFVETGSHIKERNHTFQSAVAQPQNIHRHEGHYEPSSHRKNVS